MSNRRSNGVWSDWVLCKQMFRLHTKVGMCRAWVPVITSWRLGWHAPLVVHESLNGYGWYRLLGRNVLLLGGDTTILIRETQWNFRLLACSCALWCVVHLCVLIDVTFYTTMYISTKFNHVKMEASLLKSACFWWIDHYASDLIA